LVKEEIKKEIKDFLEFNENKGTTYTMGHNKSSAKRKTHSSEYLHKRIGPQCPRRKKTKVWKLQSLIEGEAKYSEKEIRRQNVEQKLKERPSRDCPTWGSIAYSETKTRHCCGCQEVLADRSLI
jgi:hypothetical protein